MKIYFLGNYTQELVVDKYKQLCKNENLEFDIYVSGFDQYQQEIIDSNSQLNKLQPEIIYLSLDLFSIVEGFFYDDKINKLELVEKRFSEIFNLLEILITNLPNSQGTTLKQHLPH